MARGAKKEIVYTGKSAKIYEKVVKLEAELKATKEELKKVYKEQLKDEKLAAKKASEEQQTKLLKIIQESGKTPEEIEELLKSN